MKHLMVGVFAVAYIAGFADGNGECSVIYENNHCRSNFARYRYNNQKQRCERFNWCVGNGEANVFETRRQCEIRCGETPISLCRMPLNPGHDCPYSKEWEEVYGYSPQSGKCERFSYKGCGGNGNNFGSKDECWEVCRAEVADICKFPIHHGHFCSQKSETRVWRYGYNNETKRCERFSYRGCGGFENNFESAHICWTQCAGKSGSRCVGRKPTFMPGILFSKYYYDDISDTCKKFTVIRSKTNPGENKFDNEEECKRQCKADFTGYKNDTYW